ASTQQRDGKRSAADANRAIVAALKRQRVPATGFVTEQHVRALGEAGPELLREWNRGLLELGNHGATHADS
ncbi:polysaccharide deacetylase family protein, partial [Streptococcus pneumoniae]|uniref:polysaccharide deacetylase family protein n=6 Tax=Bacteria TaxID=2 RepID=UPI0013DCAAB2